MDERIHEYSEDKIVEPKTHQARMTTSHIHLWNPRNVF